MCATAGCVVAPPRHVEMVASAPPPPVRYEAPPPPPGPVERWVWQPGHWRWDGREYAWDPGHYVERPMRNAVWVPHQWVPRGNGWVMVEGHWQ
ncbi:MAG TPA: hypothetical protein VNT30_17650 [Stellaceae bacterium]|nr:hypothetical protein [Stellaceae bacterium]